MADIGFLFEQVIGLIKRIINMSFYCWGIEINIGSMFLFALLVGLALWFLGKLGD